MATHTAAGNKAADIFRSYAGTAALLLGIVIGGLSGVFFGPAVSVVKPIGDIFMNLLITLVVPLVFFSISSSICELRASAGRGSVWKILLTAAGVFAFMSVVSATLSYLGCLVVSPLDPANPVSVDGISDGRTATLSLGETMVRAVTVPDFPMLFSRSNLLPLIVFAALVGTGTSMAGQKGEIFAQLLRSGSHVTVKVMDLLMYLAPVGLGCYFADMVSSLGAQILGGYVRVFLLYCVLAAVVFLFVNPLYVLLSSGRAGLRAFWRNILPPTLTALATSSSAAAMPSCIEAAARSGVSRSVADSVVPLGINLHKNGSVLGGSLKVVFLMMMLGHDFATPGAALAVIGIAVLSAMVTGAVASGGMTGEILTCSLLGLDPAMAGVIVIIATIIDIPATVLNSTSNVVASVLVDRLAGRRRS